MVNLNSTSGYIVATLILFINTFCRYSFFYLLTPTRKSKKYNLLFILLTFPVILLINGVGDIIGFFAPFIEIFIFYIVYRQLTLDYRLCGRLLMLDLFSYITFGASALFFTLFTNYYTMVSVIILDVSLNIFEYIILTKTTIIEKLDDEYGLLYFYLILYIWISSMVIYYLTTYVFNIDAVSYIIAMVVVVSQLFFSLFVYSINKKIRQDKLSLQQINDLKIYTQQLESSQRSLRKFKHDYQNMLLSLKLSAKKSHDKELIDKLAEYSSKTLEDKVLWQFNDVDNVKDELLKSLFISKLNRIFQNNIQYSFECRIVIENLSNKYNSFDIVRILGIVYDNAIEESLEFGDEAKIDTMIYQENGELEIEIRNRYRDTDLTIQDMKKSGFTTKKNHDGLGLANIEELSQSYNDIFINYQIKDGWFTFLMVMSI
ncbi:ATPase [Ligilactobacillus salivarius]|nr:GHKL domain-containing protein [Ligilactobacillus salivarius]MYU81093.1 GHKL domain-containing protein [Ligilactobacillus salivarius]MYV08207.1 GHKL domain-containing protein [Ligilactobacillus salivarius]MYY32497.1 GHKL domain-containing protein [Ligilactobacillus salivarius]MYZ05634.1 GHKL domain-containing protein [Ligilactobacillus salivarius]